MQMRTYRAPLAASALSRERDALAAAAEAIELIQAKMSIRPDLLVVFASFHHRALFSDCIGMLQDGLHPAHILGGTAEGVISDSEEVERSPGLSVLALSMPGTVLRPFHFGLSDGPPSVWSDGFVRERVSLPPDEGALRHRGVVMIADPYSINAAQACAAIDHAAGPQGARIVGGLASGATLPRLNALAVGRRVVHEGIVGLSVFGNIEIDTVVSHGCRPVGPSLVVTKARGEEILELGGRPALTAARGIIEQLDEAEIDQASSGLLVGIASDASKPRLGRADFLVRAVESIDAAAGSIRITEPLSIGTTVQFMIRDASTAHEDLALSLAAEPLRDPAAAAILFSCNMRGTMLFDTPSHDASSIRHLLRGAPVCGFHAAGEIGPIGQRSYLHTQSASIAILRMPSSGL